MFTPELLESILTFFYSDLRNVIVYVVIPATGSIWAGSMIIKLLKRQTL